MGRGYLFGLLIGAFASVLGLSGASLMLPPTSGPATVPDAAEVAGNDPTAPVELADDAEPTGSGTVESPTEVAAAVVPEPVVEPEPVVAPEPEPAAEPEPVVEPSTVPVPVAEPEPEPEPEPEAAANADAVTEAPAEVESTATVPETPEVEVPAGSEFARAKLDEDPVLPAAEPAPATAESPVVAQPEAEVAPRLAEVSPAAVPEGQSLAPAAPAAPDAAPAIADAPAAESAVPVPPASEATAPVLETDATADTAPDIVIAEAAPAPTPAVEPVTEPAAEPATTQPAPASDPAPEPAAPEPVATEPVATEPAASVPEATAEISPSDITPAADAPATDGGPVILDIAPRAPIGASDAPQPGFRQAVPGVKVNRLPTVGGEAPAVDVPGTEAETFSPAPIPEIVLDTPALPDEEMAVARFAARFDNPEAKPLLSVIIEDIGEEDGGVGPDALAAIGRPLTIAIDPERPDAAARAAVYRLAGHEVAILAPDLPAGATASDLEISYQSYVQVLPESVALLGVPDSSFQTDRRIAQHLVALLAADGRGLVSYARGLNPARQAAAGEGLPHADVYRDLDSGGENAATVTRYLDRAAFEAARQGKVVVTGTSAVDTVAALQDWIAAGAKDTAVGPVSAAMLGD
ncbi:MAG: hypothetical protein B7Z02_06015 [Rhodobacterales bacterium 32-67-9]|nr:MAG: hypothetical protein B7Z02_06015 [Rhodobacterales bacterium 32-67-9]